MDESFKSELAKTKIATITMLAFSTGLVNYLLRAGSLFASLVSSIPLWRGFDPIAIISREKEKNIMQETDKTKTETFFDGEDK